MFSAKKQTVKYLALVLAIIVVFSNMASPTIVSASEWDEYELHYWGDDYIATPIAFEFVPIAPFIIGDYYWPDVEVINSFIMNNGLHWTIAQSGDAQLPDDWNQHFGSHVGWSNDSPRRIVSLNFGESGVNLIGNLDLSGLSQLQDVMNITGQLTSVNVSGLSQLQFLHIHHSFSLTTLIGLNDVPQLATLSIFGSSIANFDLSNVPFLEQLHIEGSPINALDLSDVPLLNHLSVNNTSLTTLNVSGLLQLQSLHVLHSPLTTLIGLDDVSQLNSLALYETSVTTLDLSSVPLLGFLNISASPISTIDLSNVSQLSSLVIDRVPVSTLDLSGLSQIQTLQVVDIPLVTLELSGLSQIQFLHILNIPLTTLELNHLSLLDDLAVCSHILNLLDATVLPQLRSLHVFDLNMTTLDISDWTQLEALSARGPISTLDVSALTQLESLAIINTYLSSLDVSALTQLNTLTIVNTPVHLATSGAKPLSVLDVSTLLQLEYLAVFNTELTELDVSNLSQLQAMDVRGNYMQSPNSIIGWQGTGLTLYPNEVPLEHFGVHQDGYIHFLPQRIPVPSVVSVEVSPQTANIIQGEQQQFTADVVVRFGANDTVEWQVDGNESNDTEISQTGLLTVAEDEIATTLTVTAVSTFDADFYDTATVTVFDKTQPPSPTITVGEQTGTLTSGEAGNVTFSLTTEYISDGTYIPTLYPAIEGITANNITISDNNGTLTINITDEVPAETHSLTVSFYDATSSAFDLVILPYDSNGNGDDNGNGDNNGNGNGDNDGNDNGDNNGNDNGDNNGNDNGDNNGNDNGDNNGNDNGDNNGNDNGNDNGDNNGNNNRPPTGRSYSPSDIAIINRIITQNNLLNATIAYPPDGTFIPDDWYTFSTWSDEGPVWFTRLSYEYLRVTELNLSSRNLTGALDVRGLDELLYLNVSNNHLTGIDVTDLLVLAVLNASNNNLASQESVIGLSYPDLPTTTFYFDPQNPVQPPLPPRPPSSPPATGGDSDGARNPRPPRPSLDRPPRPADEDDYDNDDDSDNDTDEDDDAVENDDNGGSGTTGEPPLQPSENIPTPPPTPVSTPTGQDAIDQITDSISAVHAVERALDYLLDDTGQLSDIDNSELALFAELAITQAASHQLDSNHIIVNQPNMEYLQNIAQYTRISIIEMFGARGHEFNRDLSASVAFITTDYDQINILVEPSAMFAEVDRVWIHTPYYDLSFTHTFIMNNAHTPLHIYVSSFDSIESNSPTPVAEVLMAGNDPELVAQMLQIENGGNYGSRSYNVTFSRPVTESVRLSVPPISGDPAYQAVISDTGQNAGGNHNPVTGLLDARIQQTGTYTVVENRIDFADIHNRSQEMQRAIRTLAAKGIIDGMTPTEFAPDDPLTRAQVAALVTRVLGINDPNADGGFADVNRNDWFFAAVGTANRHNIMTGTGSRTFSPHMNTPRDQLVALSARILRTEMRYRNPTNPMNYLQEFTDVDDFADWSLADLSLATRENLVVRRADGRFMPSSTITRGEAAIILYRLYRRIW